MLVSKVRWAALSVIIIIVSVYIGLVLILTLFQSRFIYFPERDISITPGAVGLGYESVDFETEDGVKLTGWFVPAANPRGVVLFFHGNAGNISGRLGSIQLFYNLGFSVFIIDYRGYGQSEGRITEEGTYLDSEAAWRYLVQNRGFLPDEIIIFGRSLGGSIAAWLAARHRPGALIIESTFTSIPDLAAKLYPFLPVRLLARYSYNTADYLFRVDCPILIIHSRDDELIPFDHGRRLFEGANEPKQLLEISGGHNEGVQIPEDKYTPGINAFITKYFRGL